MVAPGGLRLVRLLCESAGPGSGSRELDRMQCNHRIAFTRGTDYRCAGLACFPPLVILNQGRSEMNSKILGALAAVALLWVYLRSPVLLGRGGTLAETGLESRAA